MIVPFSLFFFNVVTDGFHLDYSKHLEIKVIVLLEVSLLQHIIALKEIQTYELDKRRRTHVAKFVSLKKVLSGGVGSQGWVFKTTLKA